MPGRTLAVIPARAGSKRVPGKNVRPFGGQPLLAWSIRAAQDGRPVDEVVVSSDDPACARIAADLGVWFLQRPPALAGDRARTLDVLVHASEAYRERAGELPEFVVLLQPTSPMRDRGSIAAALARMRADPRATCLQTVYPVQLFLGRIADGYWRGEYPEDTRSQDLPVFYVPSGTLYIYRYAQTLAKGDAWGSHVIPVVQDPATVVNIDHEEDFRRLADVAADYPGRYDHLREA